MDNIINNNDNIQSYTTKEITAEMDVLSHSFDVVRLVNPQECNIVKTVKETPDNTDNCFDIWNVPYQCVNCTSARALLTGHTQSKLDTTGDDIFQITSRPVNVDGRPLVLEIAKHFSYTYNRYDSVSQRKKLINAIRTINHNLLLDKETDAFNRDYMAEHFPNIFYTAQQTHQTNAALIHIQHLYDITQNEGSMAASGMICSLYSLLKQSFLDETDVGLLYIRYSPDAFLVFENNLDYESFNKRINLLSQKTAPKHLLFNNKRLPFDISIACADLANEDINSLDELLGILKTRLENSL